MSRRQSVQHSSIHIKGQRCSERNYFPGCDNVIHILYNQFFTTGWFSGFCRLLSGWPAGSAVKRASLRGEWPGLEPSYVILFLLHLTFSTLLQFLKSFFRGSVRAIMVTVQHRISVTVKG